MAGEEIDPERLSRPPARRGRRGRAGLRGGRRAAGPLAGALFAMRRRRRLPRPRPRRRPGAAAGHRRLARPRHDQPHPADDRGGPRRRPRGRGRRPDPLAGAARAGSRNPTARRSPRSARSGSRRCRCSTSRTRRLTSRATYRETAGPPAQVTTCGGQSPPALAAASAASRLPAFPSPGSPRGDRGAGQGDRRRDGHRVAERVDEVGWGSRSRGRRPRPGRSRR